jgi:Zn-dependent M28 family amino/carboxypeptidase
MMRFVFVTLMVFAAMGVAAQDMVLGNYASSILPRDLQRHVEVLASDSLQGREVGTPGGWMAGDYVATCFERYGLKAPYDGTYFQLTDTLSGARNVVGVLEGADAEAGAVVVGAHYDHHGMYYYSVYNGADDNASGVAAMLEIAEALAGMRKGGYKPQRSIIFIAYDAKERSMAGSAWYVEHPLVPLARTAACFNMDMLGRIDAPPGANANYVLVVGVDKHQSSLREVTDWVNTSRHLNLDIDYTFYGSDTFHEMFYEISDQYNFGKHGVPVIYYTSGMHDDLWKPGDDSYKLSFPVLQKRTQLIFYTVWEIANE